MILLQAKQKEKINKNRRRESCGCQFPMESLKFCSKFTNVLQKYFPHLLIHFVRLPTVFFFVFTLPFCVNQRFAFEHFIYSCFRVLYCVHSFVSVVFYISIWRIVCCSFCLLFFRFVSFAFV